MSLCAAEPMATGFPYSRTIVRIRSTRTEKKTGKESVENRYYLSSQRKEERTPEGWIHLSRSLWAGETANTDPMQPLSRDEIYDRSVDR